MLCSMHARSVRRERRAASVCVQYPVFADRPVNVWKVAQSPAIGELVVTTISHSDTIVLSTDHDATTISRY